jgi:sialate O-acetylesterase
MTRTATRLAAIALAWCAAAGKADTWVPAVFGDHMVVQRERPVPVWGRADPDQEIVVEFAGRRAVTRADASGAWRVTLEPLEASATPRDLVIGSRVIRDVLVGDVWLCSGQSNMGMSVREAADAEREIAAAHHPGLRLFSVAQHPSLEPSTDVKGRWTVCTPDTIPGFSAVAYFFGRELQREVEVPIGLLHSSVGGTPAEAWTRLEALRTVPLLADRAEKEIAQITSQDADNREFLSARAAWEERFGVAPPPVTDVARMWADPALDTSEWKEVTLPSQWARLGATSGGVFWVRKDVTLPDTAAGKPFSLSLNWVSEQYDTAFFNGVEVGRASDMPPSFYSVQRRYRVPGDLVRAGRNVIAVRIVSATQFAGMWQWGHMLDLPVPDRGAIDDRWLMRTERTFSPLPPEALPSRPKPNTLPFRCVSSALNSGMIAPLVPFAIRGVIWYQGENNVPRAKEYGGVLALMIRDWRAQWAQGDVPFIIQQLVNHGPPTADPNAVQSWPLLREAQASVAATVPRCGLAIGIDLGSDLTIHPPNKQDVGRRLALVALEQVYGKHVESSGPRYESMTVADAAIRLRFSHAEGLMAIGGPPRRFAIAGADRKFAWADAMIDGATVMVTSPDVPSPVAVRYAWADNPADCNVVNRDGLPMAPFRTDDW